MPFCLQNGLLRKISAWAGLLLASSAAAASTLTVGPEVCASTPVDSTYQTATKGYFWDPADPDAAWYVDLGSEGQRVTLTQFTFEAGQPVWRRSGTAAFVGDAVELSLNSMTWNPEFGSNGQPRAISNLALRRFTDGQRLALRSIENVEGASNDAQDYWIVRGGPMGTAMGTMGATMTGENMPNTVVTLSTGGIGAGSGGDAPRAAGRKDSTDVAVVEGGV